MPRILETRQSGNLSRPSMDKPLPLRSDLVAPSVQSTGGMGGIQHGSAHGGIPYSGEAGGDRPDEYYPDRPF